MALFILLFCSTIVQAQSVSTPSKVSALVYSSTAAELFWTPQVGSLVEVTRNGELLGQLDSRSLYQSGLQQGKQYKYTLRSIDSQGRRSNAVQMEIDTSNYRQGNTRIYPVGNSNNVQAQPTPAPEVENNPTNAAALSSPTKISAFIYSRNTVELFWTPQAGTLVEITRNGEVQGRFGSRSLYQTGLERGKPYTYTLLSIDGNGRRSAAITLVLNTANFTRPDKRIFPEANDSGQDAVVKPIAPEVQPKPEPVVTKPTNVPVNEPTPAPVNENVTQTGNNCVARDVSSLVACVRNANAYKRIDLSKDISCGSNCCPNGGALINLAGKRNLEISGNGHRLLRTNGHRQCSLLDINNGSNILISNVFLDDDKRVAGCKLVDRCPRMVHIRNSQDIRFSQARISHGKGYAFYVQGTDGFRFENSSLHNSGVLGMYIGHKDDATSNIRITGSTFSDNQTNGLALLGVRGQSIGSNLVTNNVFLRNHWRGQFAVAPKFGSGFTGGGQVYIAEASNVTFRNNVVKDGYCDNCYVQRKNRSGVTGVELGLPNQASVKNVEISGNLVSNHDAFGIHANANSNLSNVRISGNQLLNNSSGTPMSGNRVTNTQRFDSFEGGNDVGGTFKNSVSCSANGSVTRRCGAGSRFGQCSVQLKLGSADCNGVEAELVGPNVAVRAGQNVVADGWVRNPMGRWCLVFRDGSGNKLGEQCKNIGDAKRSDVQTFVGMPGIDARTPAGSKTVQLRVTHGQANATMMLDDLKVSVGN